MARRESAFHVGVHRTLGIEEVVLLPDRVVLALQVGPDVHQPYGVLHGGISAVLIESAASIGTALNIDLARERPAGIEVNANHLRPKAEGRVTAEARPLHRGRRTCVWDVRITDEEDRLISVGRCTVAVVPLDGPA